jgi:hypothetical protein
MRYAADHQQTRCNIEQSIRKGEIGMAWNLMQTKSGMPVLGFVMPAAFDKATGLTMDFGFEKTIRNDWACSKTICTVAIPFDGLFQQAVMQAQQISFTYSVKDGDSLKKMTMPSVMTGFREALKAAAEDPFGKTAQAAQAKGAKADGAKPLIAPKKSEKVRPINTADAKPQAEASNKDGLY